MKLVSAQTMKQKRLEHQRQLNSFLEKKNYSNGALRAKLLQCREFLSVATRDLSNRKLVTDRLQDGIADFEAKLKRGISSARMVRICNAKIDSLLITVDHKIANITRLKVEAIKINKESRKKYERLEERDKIIRLAIQDALEKSRLLVRRKRDFRSVIEKLDHDKMIAQNTEQQIELRTRSAHDQIKAEEDRHSSAKAILYRDIEKVTRQRTTVAFEIQEGCIALQNLNAMEQTQKEKISRCSKTQGHDFNFQEKEISPFSGQTQFRTDLTRLESEATKGEDNLDSLNKQVEDIDQAIEESRKRTARNQTEASALITSAEMTTKEEEKRRQMLLEIQTSLEAARAEVSKLDDSFREMKENRIAESRAHLKDMSCNDIGIQKQIQVVENLKLKMKLQETSLKTEIRLFEDTEKPRIAAKLKQAEENSRKEEKKYQDVLKESNDSSIDSKLRIQLKEKFSDEMMEWNVHNQNAIQRFSEFAEKFPDLHKIDCSFDDKENRSKQINIALEELKSNCDARTGAFKAAKEKRNQQKRELQLQAEALESKIKRKEELKANLKRRQLQEASKWRVTNTNDDEEKCHRLKSIDDRNLSHENSAAVKYRSRRKKGSDFFNPIEDNQDTLYTDSTPSQPRQLISSFLSQSSGQRVRWKDDDGKKTCVQKELVRDHSKDPMSLDEATITHGREAKPNQTKEKHGSSRKMTNTSTAEKKKPQLSMSENSFKLEKDSLDDCKRPLKGRRRRRLRNSDRTSLQDSYHNKELNRHTSIHILKKTSTSSSSPTTLRRNKRVGDVQYEGKDIHMKKRKKSDHGGRPSLFVRDTSSSDHLASTEANREGEKSTFDEREGGNAPKHRKRSPRYVRKGSLTEASQTSKDENATVKILKSGGSSSRSSRDEKKQKKINDRSSGKENSSVNRYKSESIEAISSKDNKEREKGIAITNADGRSHKSWRDESKGGISTASSRKRIYKKNDKTDGIEMDRDTSSAQAVRKELGKSENENSKIHRRETLLVRAISKESRDKSNEKMALSGRDTREKSNRKAFKMTTQVSGNENPKKPTEKFASSTRGTGTKSKEKTLIKSTSTTRTTTQQRREKTSEKLTLSTRNIDCNSGEKIRKKITSSCTSSGRESHGEATKKASKNRSSSAQGTSGESQEKSSGRSTLFCGSSSRESHEKATKKASKDRSLSAEGTIRQSLEKSRGRSTLFCGSSSRESHEKVNKKFSKDRSSSARGISRELRTRSRTSIESTVSVRGKISRSHYVETADRTKKRLSVRSDVKESHEGVCEKTTTSARNRSDQNCRKEQRKNFRCKLSLSVPSNDFRNDEFIRGDIAKKQKSLKSRVSSSVKGNAAIKKRKAEAEYSSLSTSNTSRNTRRRKKGTSASRSRASITEDTSCELDFQ
ncbi:unnamed protein product [Pseudo-nitzschia multistriata]|uniref:Uncharacterized protein n=1 Tax=Pseudo-nitzschia multistriata TaxID=183589 RepID=A0A448Z9L8_9STRA|nr:unnamed protein product [Pseudo-nitzschia multistriata]